jgi:hypothetical protein
VQRINKKNMITLDQLDVSGIWHPIQHTTRREVLRISGGCNFHGKSYGFPFDKVVGGLRDDWLVHVLSNIDAGNESPKTPLAGKSRSIRAL